MPATNQHATRQEGNKYQSWRTSPFDVACTISRGLADNSSVARVTYASYVSDYDLAMDGVGGGDVDGMAEAMEELSLDDENKSEMTHLWDMTRPLVGNVSKIEFLKFDDDSDAKTTFWHSSAHILGEAMEHVFGSRLTIGPPLAGGFYYDSFMGDAESGGALTESDCEFVCIVTSGFQSSGFPNLTAERLVPMKIIDKVVEQEFQKIVKSKQKFERLVVTKDEALEMFEGNPFKTQIISTKVPDGSRTTVYRCGDLVDLCRGPHLPHTGRVKAFAATRHSATNWLGDTDNDMLQRMYGISFPDKKMLKVWKENQEKVS